MNDYTVALSGSSADVAAALDGTFASNYTGNVTTSNAHTLAELKTINNGTSGSITLNDASVALSGSSADIAAALTGITSYTGTAALSSNHTLAELVTINNATSGTLTLNSYGVALSGSTSDIKAALAGNFASTYTGNVTITDANGSGIAAADISTIAGATNGTVTVSNNINITGTSAAITTAVGNVDTFSGTPTATLGDAHTLAELKAINNALSGTATLNDYTVTLSGSSSDVAAALAGTFASAYTGNVSLSDSPTLAQLKAINPATSGEISLSTTDVAYSGSSSDLALALDGTINHNGIVTITNDDYTLAQLKTINDATSGNIVIQKDSTTAELVTINNNSDGSITLSDGTQSLSGTASQLVEALAGTINFSGAVTITGDLYTRSAQDDK